MSLKLLKTFEGHLKQIFNCERAALEVQVVQVAPTGERQEGPKVNLRET